MEARMGGKRQLKIFLGASHDIRDSLLSKQHGGSQLDTGFDDFIRSEYGGRIEAELICEDWSAGIPEDVSATQLFSKHIDIAVITAGADVTAGTSPEHFKNKCGDLIRSVKGHSGAHVIAFNCSSVDPGDIVNNYYRREDTFSVRVHRFNLALFQLSVLEGISIIDVERLIGQMGGDRHVTAPQQYTCDAYHAIRVEFHRVLADIGFFEERPLVMQIGQGAKQ